MSLYLRDHFNQYAISLPSVTLTDQWHARIAKIGPKFFAALGDHDGLWKHAIIFKTTAESYEIMCTQPGITRAPYTSSTWVAVHRDSDLNDDELRAYIRQSYQLVCAKLTRKQRETLHLT